MPKIDISHRFTLPAYRRVLLAFLATAVLPTANAESDAPSFVKPLPPTQRIFIDNTNLSANDFFAAYMSKSVDERRYAELYLLGVLDATEGISWCDYRRFQTLTLGEEIYQGLKELGSSKRNIRAARLITEILANKFPCRKGKS